MSDVLCDIAAEEALISALILVPTRLKRVLTEHRLQPDHFYRIGHGELFAAVVDIADEGGMPDEISLAARLEGSVHVPDPKDFVNRVILADYNSLSWPQYAERVLALHRRRQLQRAGLLLQEAAVSDDAERVAEAESLMTTPADAEPTSWSAEELQRRFADRLDEPAPERWSWPFSKLDVWTGGGLRRKQVVLIGGWTANGKSVLYDQILDKCADVGLRCHSYINEMSEAERVDRTMARLSGVEFHKVHSRKLGPGEDVELRRHLTRLKVGITECAGWTAQEIARHIRWNRWDVAGVDIIHEIAHRDERDLAEIAQVLRTTARSTGCALIACVHLNDQRVTTPQRPAPVLRDVRGSGMLVRGADIVLLVHRKDNEAGIPQPEGVLFAAKIRNGSPNAMNVVFQPDRMRFLPRAGEVSSTPGGEW